MSRSAAHSRVDSLFRRESGRILAHLVTRFGPHRIDLAEDAVQDAMCAALQTWSFGSLPAEPGAWLMRAAKNRMIDLARRDARTARILPKVLPEDQAQEPPTDTGPLHDDQLKLMFSCCHPTLAPETQIALILKALCGFSHAEIAAAFFTSADAVEKRIVRAKGYLRKSRTVFDLDNARQVRSRLPRVQQAIYQLFSEGYHSTDATAPVRLQLCREALRLAELLVADPSARTPSTQALLALIHFSSARLDARIDAHSNFVLLADQRRSEWNTEHIALGFQFLRQSAQGDEVTRFHLEAAIAAEHCRAESIEATDWEAIVGLYELLAAQAVSPAIEINRAIAVGQARGPRAGLDALAKIEMPVGYPFLDAAKATFHAALGEHVLAAEALAAASASARTPAEAAVYRRQARGIK
jgi:RNA polymerase sigma-70 factor (ECF subfamily)